jgi:predicted transposase/invertase (TIGR01784 family)
MGRFINPFTDMGFKRIFGQEVNKNLLIDFLNDLLEGEKRIIDITFLDKEQLATAADDRSCIYDIYCENENGERFIVEMQNRGHRNFKERAIYYLSRTIANQGRKGPDWMFDLKAVYGVFFMNFHLESRQTKFRTDVSLRDMRTNEPFSDKMRFIFLDLPAFTKDEETCETDFERWIYVLKNMEILQRMPFKARKSVFEELEKIADISALSKEDQEKYEHIIKVYRDNLVTEQWAIEKGLEKGRKEGIEIERLKNARGMKAKGYPLEDIAQITGLSVEEIQKL